MSSQPYMAELGINQKAIKVLSEAEQGLKKQFEAVECMQLHNQAKVLAAFRKNRVEYRHFAGTTGYGYGDIGRDTLDSLYANIFGCEAAIVRPQIVSGTHALSLCLYGLARKGTRIISITGNPYDTLLETIGLARTGNGIDSLQDLGAEFISLPLDSYGKMNIVEAAGLLKKRCDNNIVYIQRSRGYEWRESVCIEDMRTVINALREAGSACTVVVDNCYGEFVEELEPTEVGADIAVGSLIKNPGGGLAHTGGYIVGKSKLIDRIQYRLTAPGIGREVGSWPSGYLSFYQGLFLAPHVVGESIKGAILASAVFEALGYDVMPDASARRSDITQSIKFYSEEKLLKFCRAVQSASPVDGHAIPEPWPMPGYQNDVVMAAGTFIQGSSIELSADAPIKPPYIGYLQGGLTYQHCKLALLAIVSGLLE